MRLGLWSCLPQSGDTCARWDELRMRLQHLALFFGIGLDACAFNLGSNLQRVSSQTDCGVFLPDHHTVTVEVAPDFHLRFPNVALQQDRFLRFANLRKSEIYERNQ